MSARSCTAKLVWELLCSASSAKGGLASLFPISLRLPRALLVLWAAWLQAQQEQQSLNLQLNIKDRFSIYYVMSFIYIRIGGGDGRLHEDEVQWVVADKTVEPSASTCLAWYRQKGCPTLCKTGGIFSRNHCCFLSFTKDSVFWALLQAELLTDKPSVIRRS